MSHFVQLHVLTSYPACNLNRDDMGRPKTLHLPDGERLRISSQSLKRAWRCSEEFKQALAGHLGVRTKEIGKYVYRALMGGATFAETRHNAAATGPRAICKEAAAIKIARAIGGVFAKIKAEYKKEKNAEEDREKLLESLECEQLAHLSPAELEGVNALVEKCRESGKEPEGTELDLLRKDAAAVDIALFGRMLAASKAYNVEAAAQVAHAITVHPTVVEDDFFTAVDDLNVDDSGAGHMGVSEFGAGLFYLYLCIDRELLLENLGGNVQLANTALQALIRAVCTVSPTGKQNSFASRAMASFCMAEKGDAQPRTLAEAFTMKSLCGEDMLQTAMEALEAKRNSFNRIMGQAPEMCQYSPESGTLADVCAFVAA